GCSLYLHQYRGKWAISTAERRRRNARLVQGQLPDALSAARVHDGIDAGSPLAGFTRGAGEMAQPQPFRLILASGSIGRRELLARAGYQFEVMPANIQEPDGDHYPDPRTMVQHIAWLKAAAVAPQATEGIVLAA